MDASITWPLASNLIRGSKVNNTFGMVRRNLDGTARPHQGWDFSAVVGEPAFAIADGTVCMIKDGGDYGLQLALQFMLDGTTYYAFYAHLQKVFVAEDDVVKKNAILAACGKSGNAANLDPKEDHLHFEIRTAQPPRLGLADRVSPMLVFGHCPMHTAVSG